MRRSVEALSNIASTMLRREDEHRQREDAWRQREASTWEQYIRNNNRMVESVERQTTLNARNFDNGLAGGEFGYKFSGRVQPGNSQHSSLDEYLRQLESAAAVRGVSDKGKVEMCRQSLSGDAAIWFIAQAQLQKHRSLAFISDWPLTKKYLKEQYSKVGPCYSIDMKRMFEQVHNEDAEQYYSRCMIKLDEYMEQYGTKLYEWSRAGSRFLLAPGEPPATDGTRFFQFAFPAMQEWTNVMALFDSILPQNHLAGRLRATAERLLGGLCMAYLREQQEDSYRQFKWFFKERYAMFEMVDGLRVPSVRRDAQILVRANMRKRWEDRLDSREMYVRIKNLERIASGETGIVVPPPSQGAVGAAKGELDFDVELDEDVVDKVMAAAMALQKAKKKGKKGSGGGGSANGGGGNKSGGGSGGGGGGKNGTANQSKTGKKSKVGASEADEPPRDEEKKRRKCTHCKMSGHTVEDCWTKYPERRPERFGGSAGEVSSGKNGAISASAPEMLTPLLPPLPEWAGESLPSSRRFP